MAEAIDVYRPRVYTGTSAAARIVPSGYYFVDGDGQIVIRKSITAFTAPKRFAPGGDADQALRFFDAAAALGLNEVRPFSRVDWTGPPGIGVETGWQFNESACVRTIEEARQRGLRVELVAHTGRYGTVQEMADHLRRVDEVCLTYDNAFPEVLNEPQGNGGNDLVDAILAIYTPRTSGWSTGVYDPTPYTPSGRRGQSLNYHSPRKAEWSRCAKDAIEYNGGDGPNQKFDPPWNGPVMLDEPPRMEENRSEDDWRAYGAGCAFFGCGGTAHSIPFQKCDMADLTPYVAAFVAGLNDVPVQRYRGYMRGDPPGSDPGSRRYWRYGEDGQKYEICVRPYAFKAVA